MRPLLAQTKAAPEKVAKIPITTSSEEARKLYLQGRDLAEKLRATDARRFYEQAVAADKAFALGYVGLANTSGTTKEFIDATTRAAALAGQVSEGERHMILGARSRDERRSGQRARALHRARAAVSRTTSGRRRCSATPTSAVRTTQAAVKHFVKATAINPSFSQPYNQMGYAYRFLEQFHDAENAFKKYTQLIPERSRIRTTRTPSC